jgi:oligopeptide/dipeptide ABC transporter ATP-binding protein
MEQGESVSRPTDELPSASAKAKVIDSDSDLLEVGDLRVNFFALTGVVSVLRGVNFSVAPGEILGIVGETGSGKSVTALSIARLLPRAGRVVGGRVLFRGQNLYSLQAKEMRHVRGNEISMIFQNPRSSLNPVFRVGKVLGEILRVHSGLQGRTGRDRAMDLLADVGLSDPASVLRQYPHELSGGMAQRVMIAMALASTPHLLVADEPTTALDVTIQYQIISLLSNLRSERGLAQILITHNLGVIAELCDRVVVMYAGAIVEEALVTTIFDEPRHPYTRGLLAARVRTESIGALASIPGQVPDLREHLPGCAFQARCAHARDICREVAPLLTQAGSRQSVACHRWREIG